MDCRQLLSDSACHYWLSSTEKNWRRVVIRVLVADQYAVLRAGLKQIIGEAADMVVASEVSDWYELLEAVKKDKYDVLLLDIDLPGIKGLDALKKLKKKRPDLPILVFSMYTEEQ